VPRIARLRECNYESSGRDAHESGTLVRGFIGVHAQMMRTRTRYAALAALLTAVSGGTLSQESTDGAEGDAPQRIDHCVSAPAILDVNVWTDAHVYVRTRGNHYLLTTAECPDLMLSYQRAEVRLIPYGNSVCQGDGSYFVYLLNRHERACPILTIDRVANRAEAKLLVSGRGDLVEAEKADPPP